MDKETRDEFKRVWDFLKDFGDKHTEILLSLKEVTIGLKHLTDRNNPGSGKKYTAIQLVAGIGALVLTTATCLAGVLVIGGKVFAALRSMFAGG